MNFPVKLPALTLSLLSLTACPPGDEACVGPCDAETTTTAPDPDTATSLLPTTSPDNDTSPGTAPDPTLPGDPDPASTDTEHGASTGEPLDPSTGEPADPSTGEPEPGDTTTGEPVDVCAIEYDIEVGDGCFDGVQAPAEFCFGFGGGGPIFHQGLNSFVAGHFNHTGGLDVLMTHHDLTITWENDGPEPWFDMDFGLWPKVFPADAVTLTSSGHLDADGHLDAVGRRTGGTGDTVEIFFTDGLSDLLKSDSVALGQIVFGPEILDWDLDGDLDILVITDVADNPQNVIVLAGDGSGTFVAEPKYSLSVEGGVIAAGTIGPHAEPDDLAFVDATGAVGVVLDGTTQLTNIDLGAHAVVHDLAITDLDEDRLGDIIALVEDTATGATALHVLLNHGDPVAPTVTVYPVRCGATTFAIGDLDQDGVRDIAAGGPGDDSVTIRRGDAQGGFSHAATIDAAPADELVIGDFNGDGTVDLASADHVAGMLTYSPSEP